MTTILVECPFCGSTSTVEVMEEDYLRYMSGELVQNCFPYLSADERELLISGVCPECWEHMFSPVFEEE